MPVRLKPTPVWHSLRVCSTGGWYAHLASLEAKEAGLSQPLCGQLPCSTPGATQSAILNPYQISLTCTSQYQRKMLHPLIILRTHHTMGWSKCVANSFHVQIPTHCHTRVIGGIKGLYKTQGGTPTCKPSRLSCPPISLYSSLLAMVEGDTCYRFIPPSL